MNIFNTTAIASLFALIGANAFAETNFEGSLTVSTGNLFASISGKEGDFNKAKIGYQWFKHGEWEDTWRFRIYTGLEYDFDLERTKLVNDFRADRRLGQGWSMYAIANVDYIIDDEDALIIGPTMGLTYSVSDNISLYGDLTFSFDATDSFDYIGGEVGGGVSYGVSENVWLTVGFTRNFATSWDEVTDVYVNTTIRF